MAVDDAGNALSWTGGSLSSWKTYLGIDTASGSGIPIYSVSCSTTTFCMAVDYSGNALSWDGSAWSKATPTGDSNTLTSVSCPTTFCMAVDGSGNALSFVPPPSPSNVSASFSSSGASAAISWSAPTGLPSSPTYDVTVTDETAGITTMPITTTTSTPSTVSSLTPGHVYRFSVSAVISGGLVSSPAATPLLESPSSGSTGTTVSAVCRWNGGGGTSNEVLSSPSNWMTVSPVSLPSDCGGVGNSGGPPSGSQLVFPSLSSGTNTTVSTSSTSSSSCASSSTSGDITFSSIAFEGGSYDLAGSTTVALTAATSTIAILDQSSGTTTLSAPLTTPNAGQTAVDAGNLTLSCASSLPSGQISTGSGATLEFATGMAVPNSISGSGALLSSPGSSNEVTLSGTNSYTGSTTVSSGTLAVANGYALGGNPSTAGSGGLVTIDSGATLQVGVMNTPVSISNDITFEGGSTLATPSLSSPATSFTLDGTVTLDGIVTIDPQYYTNLYLAGQVTGTGSITTDGPFTTWLSNSSNSYSGGTTVASSGTLVVEASGALGTGLVTDTGSAPIILEGSITMPNAFHLAGTSSICSGILCDGSSSFTPSVPGGADTVSGTVTLTDNTSVSAVTSAILAITGTISGSYNLTTSGNVVVSGDNTHSYTGAATVAEGTLDVTGSIGSSSGLTVEGGATLEGTGTVPGITTSGCSTSSPCTIYPGDAPGVLTSSGVVNLSISGSTLELDLSSTSPSTYSELVANGGNISGANLDITSAASAAYGTTYTILKDTSSSAFSGELSYGGSSLTQGETFSVAGRKFQISYTGGSSGHDVTLTDVTNPPPPPPPAPSITSISPSTGSTNGGTTVTITGDNLSGVAYVYFGSVAATSFNVVSPAEIQAVSPAESASTVNITVTTPGGTSPVTSADQFTYTSSTPTPQPPTVTSITPTSGSTNGGTSVTITGTGFVSGATVKFGSVPATAVTVNSATSIMATSPAESASTVNITVTTPGGTSTISSADQFTYVKPVATITGDAYTAINPARLADTRCSESPAPSYCAAENLPSANANLTSIAAGGTENITVTGVDSIPITATAVVINVTAVNMTANGYLSIYPEGSTSPVVSSLNWTATSAMVTNLVTVPVNTTNGEITIENGGKEGTVYFVVDIEGYYAPPGSTPAGLYNPAAPTRIADTRCSESPLPPNITSSYCASLPSANSPLSTIGAGQTENVTVIGVGGIPTSGVSAVVLNLTAIGHTKSGYLTAYPTGTTKALVSTVNFNEAQTVPNRVIVKVGANGEISIYNNSGNTNFTVDVTGYYTDGASSSQTGSLFNPVTPARILDTRCSELPQPSYCASENLPSSNATLSAIQAGKSITIQVAGEANIPSDATAVVGNLTATGSSGGGYLTIYSGSTAATTSDVNFATGTAVANMVISELNFSGQLNIEASATVNALFDIFGWFGPMTT